MRGDLLRGSAPADSPRPRPGHGQVLKGRLVPSQMAKDAALNRHVVALAGVCAALMVVLPLAACSTEERGTAPTVTATETVTATLGSLPEATVPNEAGRTPTKGAAPTVTVTREAVPAPTVTRTVSARVGSVTVCDFTNPSIPKPNPVFPFDFMLSVDRDGSSDPVVKAAVRSVQEVLVAGGYTGLTGEPTLVDGVYGRNTAHAVRQFQKDAGIIVDGRVGPQTWAALGNQFCWMFH